MPESMQITMPESIQITMHEACKLPCMKHSNYHAQSIQITMHEALPLPWQRKFIVYYQIWVVSPNSNSAYPRVVHFRVNSSMAFQRSSG